MRRKRRLTKRKLEKRKHKIIVLTIVLSLIFTTVGYGAFQTMININITGKVKKTDYYVSTTGNDTTGDGTLENPYLTIQKAYAVSSKVANIHIMNDINVSDTILLNNDKKITLESYNGTHSIIRNSSFKNLLINQSQGLLNLKNITVDGKDIESDYPLISVTNKSILKIMEKTTIKNSNNVSTICGGGIYVNNSSIELNGGTIKNNINIQHNGGGICANNNSDITINSGIIEENSSLQAGGIMLYDSHLTINDGLIQNNTAELKGGAIYSFASSSITMLNGNIIGNYAGSQGGGIAKECVDSDRCNTSFIKGGNIKDNNAYGSGGGIYISRNTNTTLDISGVTLENNSAGASGGAIYNNGILKISGDITLNSNTASNGNNIFNHTISTCTPQDKCELYSMN